MKITDSIREYILQRAADHRVHRALIGLIYCAVQLEGGTTGVAFTFPAQATAQPGRARPCGAGLSGQGNLAGNTGVNFVKN